MRIMRAVTFSAVGLAAMLQADTLRMKDGRVLTGSFEGADRNDVRFRPDSRQMQHFNRYDVDSISFDDGGTRADSGFNTGNRNNDGRGNADRTRYDRTDSSQGYNSGGYVIPAGTVISARMIDSVDSDSTHVGETYRASLDQPIVVDGQTIATSGSDATVSVVRVQQGGRISGNEEVALALSSFNSNGRTFELNTNNETVSSGSRGKQSGEVIGGGAALGAIIGALAGGGRGAAIGAASGGALGAGAQVLRGQRVRVPAETRLSFTLAQDVRLR